MSLNLHDVLNNSYASRDKQKGAFKNQGYVFDSDLSDINQQVYYNPREKKLLYSVKGTNPLSLKDLGTDAYLAMGKLKDTNRYKEAEKKLQLAKTRYSPKDVVVAGHSLGGSISQYIAGKNDKVYTLNKGATIGQKTRSNENAFRTKGDAVSLLNSNSTRMQTLKNPNIITKIRPVDALLAHNVSNIKKENIFV
jgi:hypothetical protein